MDNIELIIEEKYVKPVPTICLNMIVKNETKTIQRLLESVVHIIDCYCICDTGSTDDTPAIIHQYFKEKNIPGKFIFHEFQNFSYNRNYALKMCMNMSDYILLLDADMILQTYNLHWNKEQLGKYDVYYLFQGNDTYFYKNVRIVRNHKDLSYIGATHEYISFPSNFSACEVARKELFILDLGDGGAKENKFERDIILLSAEIEREPINMRSHFYLANSYFDIGEFEKAIPIYLKRIQLGGWIQEIWYSYYRIGLCYQKLGKMSDAIYYWLEGYHIYPERLEGLYEIIYFYRNNGKHLLADLYYGICKKQFDMKHSRNDYLFLSDDIYTYKLYYEYSIFSYYVGNKNIQFETIQILNYCTTQTEIDNLFSNMKFYKNVLPPIQLINFTNEILVNINNIPTRFYSSSSCIIPNKKENTSYGYLMNQRYVNYRISDNGDYLDCAQHIISINCFLELDNKFRILSHKIFDTDYDDRRYLGIEDIRIVYDNKKEKYQFIGTTLHRDNHIGMVYGDYNIETNLQPKELTNIMDCDKNWVYLPTKEELFVIYSWFPLKIGLIDENQNRWVPHQEKQMPNYFSRIRGSTCGIFDEEKKEYWFVCHFVSYEKPRHYYHIFVVFDEQMELLKYSAPFKFTESCIEYCLGLIVEKERIILTYSTMDRTTQLGIYAREEIEKCLFLYEQL